MGEVKLADALKTVEGICRLYSVKSFIDVELGRIAVYNVPGDNFHFFKWHGNRYVYDGSAEHIPNWLDNCIAM